MLKFSDFFEFSKEKIRKIPISKEFEWFEWFGPSPIEPFHSAWDHRVEGHLLRGVPRHAVPRQDAGQGRLPAVRKQGIEIGQAMSRRFILRTPVNTFEK